MILSWPTLDLGVEMECGDHVLRTSDLEAHVVNVIFDSNDVGQREHNR